MDDAELERLAAAAQDEFVRRSRTMPDFLYDETQGKYWDVTTGLLLVAASVDGAVPRADWPTIENADGELRPYPPSKAINDVATGLTVEGATWWPGRPARILNEVVGPRGSMYMKGAQTFNAYVAPDHSRLRLDGSPEKWIQHIKLLFPDVAEHEHFFDFCAHMLQRPDEKVNHGIVMAGAQGIGKDTALLPVRRGVGEWNAAEISPDEISGTYNGYLRSVLLVINEVRPHDEAHRASNFYNQLKPLLASPPEMLGMNLKYANTIYVRNICHVLLTTNDPLTMFIPGEDRRLFVMTSPLPDPKQNKVFSEDYFDDIHTYLAHDGADAVIRWLNERPLLRFNSCAPPPMTAGKQAIIESAHQVRRTEFDELFEKYLDQLYEGKKPDVVFHRDLSMFVQTTNLFDDAAKTIASLNARNFHFKMDERGYDMLRNPYTSEWANGKYRSRIAFVLKSVPRAEQMRCIELELRRRPLAMPQVPR